MSNRARVVALFLLLFLPLPLRAGEFRGAVAEVNNAPQERTPRGGRTLVFCRGQFKYPLYGNYTRRWLDRPLLHDRSLLAEDEPYLHVNYAGFARMLEIARTYELDGFAFFPQNPGMHFTSEGKPTSLYDFSDRAYTEGFGLLPEFTTAGDMAGFHQALAEALASKSVIRIGGKVLFTSYVADGKTPDEWKSILAELRSKHGDTFLFLPDLTKFAGKPIHEWIRAFDTGQPIAEDDLRAIKAYLRSYLDVCDGLYFAETVHLRTKERKFHAAFYRDFVIPIYQSVLAEPAYRDKLFGLTAVIGYFMPESGVGTNEDGTKTLRRSFEAAAGARPDVINLPEWDEENENTCFRPTVFNSFSTQRILKYYMRRIRGQSPAPNPGDDLSRPNLIVSYRKMLALGERLEIELLNVPDSDVPGRYDVTLTLKGLDGRIVKQFEPQTLASHELADKTLTVPTEELAGHVVLIPSITVNRGGESQVFEEGLHYLHLRATWNWDQKWVKQPLRDLCRPTRASFAPAEPSSSEPGQRVLAGSFACDEDLAFLELLENDDVVYARDPRNEYLRDSRNAVLLAIERRSLRRVRLVGSVTVCDAACRWLGPDVFQHWARDYRVDGNTLAFNSNVDWYVRCAYVAIPKADVEKAWLDFDCNLFKTRVPVKRILEEGIYSETHDDGLSLTVSRHWKQPSIPYHLGSRSAEFTAEVRPEMNTSVFHMRAITRRGKFHYSRPLILPEAAEGKPATVHVYSDTAGKAVAVEVDRARIPDVTYEFTPARGAILATAAGRPFWGILGGYSDSATGRGGAESTGGTPFRFGTRNYPAAARQTAPQWVEEDGRNYLKFDGVGNYLLLPVETTPRRAGFTLSMEIKPAAQKPQVLWNCHSYYVGSLMVTLDRGKLGGVYHDQYLRAHRLNPKLTVESGRWSQVEVLYDQESIRFRVNGKTSEPIACPGPGMYLGMSVFGGFGKGGPAAGGSGNNGWFEGLLRSLRIVHAD